MLKPTEKTNIMQAVVTSSNDASQNNKKINDEFNSIPAHWRFISDENNIIIINRAASQAHKPKLTCINLNERFIPAPKETGRNKVFPILRSLKDYPHLCNSIRVMALQLTNLYGSNGKEISSTIISKIYYAIRFMYFIAQRGKYFLCDVTRTDIDAFIRCTEKGWYSILNMEKKWDIILDKIKNNSDFVNSIVSRNGTAFTINKDKLLPLFGFDIPNKTIPCSIYVAISKVLNVKNQTKRGKIRGFKSSEDLLASQVNITSIFRGINALREIPSSFDRLPFLPFHSPKDLAKNLMLKPKGRTENISLEDTVKLLDTSLKWIYDYSPIILKLLNKTKDKIISINNKSNIQYGYKTELLNDWFRSEWKKMREDTLLSELDVETLNVRKNPDTYSFLDLIYTLQTACTVVIGINNGRRKNEIIGENVEYGLHYGCITKHNDGILSHKKIKIYIEKTVQEYCDFWVNDLTVDAVSLLENIYELFQPIGHQIEKNHVINKNITEKLFRIKNITVDGFPNKNWRPFIFSEHSKLFFQQANVSNKNLHDRTHPFRRIFSLIYHFRFKNQKLISLSQHLRHTSYEMTRVYISDTGMRIDAERVEKLYKLAEQENEHMKSIDMEVQHEFAIELVSDVLNGRAAGGYTKRIKRLHNLLLVRTKPVKGQKKYITLSQQEQTDVLTDSIEKHGNRPNSRHHGVCWATDNHKGACRNNKTLKLERDNAIPTLCVHCAYNQYSEEYISNLNDDHINLTLDAKNYNLPKVHRHNAKVAANNLYKLIELEQSMINSVNLDG